MSEWTREKLDELIEGTLNDLGAEYGYHLEQRVIRQVALREFRDAILASQSERVQCELTREKLEDALQDAWNDWVSDTGCVPDFLDIHGPATTRVTADFRKCPNFIDAVLWRCGQSLKGAGE